MCTIPLSILSRIPLAVVEKMAAAIGQMPYAASVKVRLQFKRRFWEEDEAIYGGISYTDLPITLISYPSTGFQSAGKGVLLGAYVWGLEAFDFTSMTPPQRVAKALEYGTQLHLAAAFAAALLALMLPPAIGPAAAQSSDATPLYPQAAFAAASGATVYAAICQSCHMPGGHGARGGGEYPALAGNPKLAAAPYVAMIVLDGRGGMPGFAGMLNDQQVAEVAHYVRSQFGNDYPGTLSADEVRTLRH